jgi:hypothetical protein
VVLKGTTEQGRLGSDGDEATKTDAEEPKESTDDTVAKSLKCNEYVYKIYIGWAVCNIHVSAFGLFLF